MKYIAIIAAEDKEVSAIYSKMSDASETKVYDITIYIGKMNGKDVLLTKSGVGKVNAARVTQILIDKFDVSCIINTGSAGALDDRLKIGDIVISSGLVQHDFDVTAFGREPGYIPDVGKIFEPDTHLVNLFLDVINKLNATGYKGTIATGDKFLKNSDEKLNVYNIFDAICVEMEGAAVSHVCKLSSIPFVVIRSISDELNGDAILDFNEYLELASARCADIIYNTIDKI